MFQANTHRIIENPELEGTHQRNRHGRSLFLLFNAFIKSGQVKVGRLEGFAVSPFSHTGVAWRRRNVQLGSL